MGYQAARVQNITRSAGLGLSAINYHFGGKEGLYRAVLSHTPNRPSPGCR
jgi:AcrR family transcriptional regulator